MNESIASEKSMVSSIFDRLLPPEARTKEEFLTVLNAVTLGRLIGSFALSPQLREDPGGNWLKSAILAAGDKESILAKPGDLPKVGEFFKGIGFRRSEVGRRADPVVDKIVGYKLIRDGMTSGAVPNWLGRLTLGQKTTTAVITVAGELRGRDMKVPRRGQIGELVTDVGLVGHFAAESIGNPAQKTAAKIVAGAVTVAGVSIATYTTLVDYIPQAFGNLPKAFEPYELNNNEQVA